MRIRGDQNFGTAWTIDLGSEVPFGKLIFSISDDDFVRDYELETLDNPERERQDFKDQRPGMYTEPYRDERAPTHVPGTVVARGQWRRRAGSEHKPLEIRFGTEMRARMLKLIVTDNRNPPLHVESVDYSAAARQVIFERPKELAEPLRLYFGNPSARAPDYDFAGNLPAVIEPPQRLQLAQLLQNNPDYRPTLKAWTDRWPWVIYVILGVASAALLGILGLLARQTIQRHDETNA